MIIYVADTYRGHDQVPVACEVLSGPRAKFLRIDASKWSADRKDAFFDPAKLGREVWPKNRGYLWGGERLHAFASMQEFHDRVEVRERLRLLLDQAHRIQRGDARVSLEQLRQACAHLGVAYECKV